MRCSVGRSTDTSIDFEEALAFTQDKRPAALPNPGFTTQLKEFQKSESLTNLREKFRFS